MTEISVFGGKGFVGSECVKLLGDRAFVHDREDYFPLHPKILYLISTVHNYHIFDDPFLDIETNLITLIRVLESARLTYGSSVDFTFISSWFVYGENLEEECVQEDAHCNPKGFYSITKRTAEQLLESYCNTYRISYRILRLPNVLGVNDNKVSSQKNALQWLIREMILDNPISLYHGGDFYRDYMDVRDVARAIVLVMDNKDNYPIYNVTSDDMNKFGELFWFCYNYSGSESEVSESGGTDFHSVVQVKSMCMDNELIQDIGFIPSFDIYDTLKEIVDKYKNELLV